MRLYRPAQQQSWCAACPSSRLERVPGADHHLCRHDRTLRAFGRERVAAALAFAEVCRGRWHPKWRAA